MQKIFRWMGIGLLVLVLLVLLISAGLYLTTTQRINKVYNLPNEQIVIPTDIESINRGQRLVVARCAGCHGENLAGTILFEDPTLGTISAANLTEGRGTGGDRLQDVDYIRAIRHGIDHSGHPILTMPSDSFYYINDVELGEMVAFLKSSGFVENSLPETRVKPLGIVLIGVGAFGDLIAAEKIDHQAPRPASVEPGVTIAYGDYLVRVGQCRTCHGQDLTGGKDSDPNAPPAPDLTQNGELSTWDEASFILALQTGKTPTGRQMNQFMPWKYIGQMTEDELSAMWVYLQSLPPQQIVK